MAKNQLILAFLAAAALSKILEMSADADAFFGGLPPWLGVFVATWVKWYRKNKETWMNMQMRYWAGLK